MLPSVKWEMGTTAVGLLVSMSMMKGNTVCRLQRAVLVSRSLPTGSPPLLEAVLRPAWRVFCSKPLP